MFYVHVILLYNANLLENNLVSSSCFRCVFKKLFFMTYVMF